MQYPLILAAAFAATSLAGPLLSRTSNDTTFSFCGNNPTCPIGDQVWMAPRADSPTNAGADPAVIKTALTNFIKEYPPAGKKATDTVSGDINYSSNGCNITVKLSSGKMVYQDAIGGMQYIYNSLPPVIPQSGGPPSNRFLTNVQVGSITPKTAGSAPSGSYRISAPALPGSVPSSP